jgi:hypothetical protein
MPETLALCDNISVTVVPKAYPVRAAGLRHSKHFSRSLARGWTRAARICLVFLACLAPLWMPAQHRHAPGLAAHSIVFDTVATGSGPTLASFDVEKSGVRCAPAFGHAASHDDDTPAPCQQDNCPCCEPVQAAAGILPPETTRAAYAPRLSKTLAPSPPAVLGSLTRPTAFDGQPRAPPILI